MNDQVKTVISEDGLNYRALQIPGSVTFSGALHSASPVFGDDYEISHAYVRCEEIRTNCLPLDANPREPTRVDVVNKMAATLLEEPGKFHHWNNGITIVCEGVEYDAATANLTLSFGEGEGVCNGGHTYFSIVTQPTSLDSKALVHLEVIRLPDSLSAQEKNRR